MVRLTKRRNRQTYLSAIQRIAMQAGKRANKYSNNTKLTKIVYFFVSLSLVSLSVFVSIWWFSGWNGKDPVNVVVGSGDQVFVLAVRPSESQLAEVEIPSTAVIETSDAGTWRVGALWEAGELAGQPRIVEAVGWDLLEIPVDFIIRTDEWPPMLSPCRFQKLWRCDLRSLGQNLRLRWFYRSLRSHQLKRVRLAELPIARRIVDPGGGEQLEIDRELLSPRVSEWFEIAEFRRSGLTVAVRGDDATVVARQLEHVGLRVVSARNSEGEQGVLVRSAREKKSSVVNRISGWYQLPVHVSDFEERADVLVVH